MTTTIKGVLLQMDKPTHNGRIYPDNAANRKALKDFSSRVDQGQVYCELGTPPRPDSMSTEDYLQRVRRVDPTRVAAQIKSVRVNADGQVIGDISPVGPLKDILFKENHDIQMGLRGFVKPTQGSSRNLTEIITFDVVDVSPSE